MKRLINKTFYQLLFGFVAIVFLSFAVIGIAGYIDEQNIASTQASIECDDTEEC